MQSLIQDIFSQIIDSSPYFPERLYDFSCMRSPSKQNVLSHVNSFWSENYTKCQKWFWIFEAYLKWNFCNCSTQPLWLWSRIGSRVKITHYIQPIKLSSSALEEVLQIFLTYHPTSGSFEGYCSVCIHCWFQMFACSNIPKEYHTVTITNCQNVALEWNWTNIALAIPWCDFLYRLKLNVNNQLTLKM